MGRQQSLRTAAGQKEKWEDFAIEMVHDSGYAGADSFQPLAVDYTPGAAVGTSDAGDSSYQAPIMGNILGANFSKTQNYIAGLIGAYNVTGTNANTYPVGAVVGEIGDGTTTADGAFIAVIGGDSATTTARAGFKVMSNNSTAASGFDFGLDLQDAAHDGYAAVDEDFYLKAPLRLVRDVVILVNDAAPVNGTSGSGAGDAGVGSLYIDATASTGVLYINTNTKASPTWTKVGTQA